MISIWAAVWAPTPKPAKSVGAASVVRRVRCWSVRRDVLSQGKPATGKRPEGVRGGGGGRVERARSEGGAAREQMVIGEGVEGFSQVGWRIHDDLLQRDHRRGTCFPGRIPRDLELPDHLDALSPVLGVAVAWPANTDRAALSASPVSDLPTARRVCRSPRFTSTTRCPAP